MAPPLITQTITAISLLIKRITVSTPAEQDAFVEAYETTNDELSDNLVPELNELKDQENILSNWMNDTAIQVDSDATSAAESALIANSNALYKGDWVVGYETTGYSLGFSVSYTDGFRYVSKIDNNLIEPTTQTNTSEWDFVEAIDPNSVYTKIEADAITDKNARNDLPITIDLDADADQTLTTVQAEYGTIEITDNAFPLTAQRTITLPNIERIFLLINNADFPLNIISLGGTGIIVEVGERVQLRNDSTNITIYEGERVLKTAEVIQWEEDNAQFLTWAGGVYTDPDVVGSAVNPTATIYPDGTIVGETDNLGGYTDYPNGDLICRHRDTVVQTTSVSLGSIFSSPNSKVFVYPRAFAVVPDVTPISKLGSGRAWGVLTGNTTLQVGVYSLGYNSGNTGFPAYISIGRKA